MIEHALKEWAAVCRALAAGRQSILIRKGGIAEPGGEFRLEAKRFWMYPTFIHQAETGVRRDESGFQEIAERDRPMPGTVRISEWAEVTGIYQVRDQTIAQMLAHLHIWSDEAIAKRYAYRQPGVDVLSVRVHRMPASFEIAETPEHIGCKSWVKLDRGYSTAGSTPAMTDAEYRDVIVQLDTLLRPTARV